MSRDWRATIRRGLRKPPRVILRRVGDEARAELDRFLAPWRARRLDARCLVRQFGVSNIDALWAHLSQLPYFATTGRVARAEYESICPGDTDRILRDAEHALGNEVDLLGSGPMCLGESITWNKDYKSDFHWSDDYIRSIEYANPERPSDVKFPWEVSRLQWLMPAGQAYLLTGEERYARKVRDVLSDWIARNPYAASVNWVVTMEVALRILSWSWFFHVFKASEAWRGHLFRERFITALFLHCDFAARHLERSDVNGNHYTADAAGLVFAGLFFRGCEQAARWLDKGWRILVSELPLQVSADGVDFEGSVAYHRLVQELFFLPALYRECHALQTPPSYRDRVAAMARFSQAYTQPDGAAPLVGDADDARALPFGGQGINDHRYLAGIVGGHWGQCDLIGSFSGSKSEVFWLLGAEAADRLPDREFPPPASSRSFPEGGYYILGYRNNHVFVDCAPVGLAGRGGHGHNDCLSFEAALAGEKLISDCGAYLYTASYEDRNLFRSTAYHNTPRIDGEEINRFIRPDYLWNLHYDARPRVDSWEASTLQSTLRAGHSGFERLTNPVSHSRLFVLRHRIDSLYIRDYFEGEKEHRIEIPLHLAPGVSIRGRQNDRVTLVTASGMTFVLAWESRDFLLNVDEGRVSQSYGVVCPSVRLVFQYQGKLPIAFCAHLSAEDVRSE